MSKKGSKGKGRLNKGAVVDMMVDFFNRNDSRIVSPKEIFKELNLTSTSARTLCVNILDDMVFDGYLIEPEFRKYRLADNSSILVEHSCAARMAITSSIPRMAVTLCLSASVIRRTHSLMMLCVWRSLQGVVDVVVRARWLKSSSAHTILLWVN